jgi:ATP-dependent DNA helicase DinG
MYHLATLANIQGGVPTALDERLRYFYGAAKDSKADRRAFQFLNKLKRLRDTMKYIGDAADPDQRSLRYVEYPQKPSGGKLLSKRPIDIGPILKTRLFPNRKVMAVSATITVGKSFDRFQRAMGFPAETLTYEAVSPFDFDRRALLYLSKNVRLHPSKDKSVPPGQYDTTLDKYFDEMADDMYALCNKSNGHAFALFTSTTEMNSVFTKFMMKMQVNQFTLVQQGQYSPAQAERKFRESKNPVLFGLKSFWEGISIEGDQLRLVMIAKVPFPQRDDLLHEELKKQLEEQLGSGYRAFMELDVTQMVMETKQAAGRLLRTMNDYGVVAILDRKISEEWKTARNSYAKILVHDLPFTQVTSDLAFVSKFLQQFQMKDRGDAKK